MLVLTRTLVPHRDLAVARDLAGPSFASLSMKVVTRPATRGLVSVRLKTHRAETAHATKMGVFMLQWALVFLIVAIVAGVFGLSGIAGTAANIAWILFLIGLVLAVVFFVRGRRARI
jgi:uncharacterized membrane protein YtjA (UPF0391 family)